MLSFCQPWNLQSLPRCATWNYMSCNLWYMCFATTDFIKITPKNDKAWIILILQWPLRYLEPVKILLELKGKEVQTRTSLGPSGRWPWETSLPFSFACVVSLQLSSANGIVQKSEYTFIGRSGNTLSTLRYLMEKICSF